jgi:hypothetical protein
MKKTIPAASPDAYVAALSDWRRDLVELLRGAVLAAAPLEERIKWGHLVYFANGPVLLIRAEDDRVLFGFWRGQRLLELELRLKPGGQYEMATADLRAGAGMKPTAVKALVRAAVALNKKLGDPTAAAKTPKAAKTVKTRTPRPRADRVSSKPAVAAARRRSLKSRRKTKE